jgi:hypothetical protein
MADSQARIFISYRREDSAGHVLALLPALRRQFGDRVFKDTDNIPPGENFVRFIKNELDSCSVLLAVIGRDWLNVQDPRLKTRRLDNPDDFLRIEVSTALRSERIRVIPVLVERSTMPSAADLPQDLAELANRNALELSDARWDSDVQLLIQAIQRAFAETVEPTEALHAVREFWSIRRYRALGVAAAFILSLAIGLWQYQRLSEPTSTPETNQTSNAPDPAGTTDPSAMVGASGRGTPSVQVPTPSTRPKEEGGVAGNSAARIPTKPTDPDPSEPSLISGILRGPLQAIEREQIAEVMQRYVTAYNLRSAAAIKEQYPSFDGDFMEPFDKYDLAEERIEVFADFVSASVSATEKWYKVPRAILPVTAQSSFTLRKEGISWIIVSITRKN